MNPQVNTSGFNYPNGASTPFQSQGCDPLINSFGALQPQIGAPYTISFGMVSAANGIQDPAVTIGSRNPQIVERTLANYGLEPIATNGDNVSYNLHRLGSQATPCINSVRSNTISF